MAKIITVAQTKGGTGKSTCVYFLYEYFTSLGASAVILDLDLQKTITQLNSRLEKGLKIINPPTLSEIYTLPYDFIFIDTPPYRTGESSDIYRQSDFVLIPVKPSYLDAMATETILNDLKQYDGLKYAALITQVKHGTSYTADIRSVLEDMEIPILNTQMFHRVAYSRGMLLPDWQAEQDTKAIQEVSNIANEILTLIVS